MATSKSRPSRLSAKGRAAKPVRFVKKTTASRRNEGRDSRRTASRATIQKQAPTRKSVESNKRARPHSSTESPQWRDLAKINDRKRGPHPEIDSYLGALSTTRFAAIVLAVVTLFTLYVGHVFSTQKLSSEVGRLRNENLALQMSFDKLEGEFNYQVGPKAIFVEAEKLGLRERLPEGNPITLD